MKTINEKEISVENMDLNPSYSGRETIPKSGKVTWRLALVSLVAVFGNSFPMGYHIGVVNPPQLIFENFLNTTLYSRGFHLTYSGIQLLWSLIVSSFLIGAIGGSLVAGSLTAKFGRKFVLIVNCIGGLIAAAMFGATNALQCFELLICGRMLVGFCGGMGAAIAPMYLAEVAPPHLAGAVGVLQNLGMTTGLLFAQICGQQQILGTNEHWPILLALYGVFLIICLFFLPLCPESPSFLYCERGNTQKAFQVLESVRGVPLHMLTDEIACLKEKKMLQETIQGNKMGFLTILKNPSIRKPFLLVCALHVAQQFSGINAIFFYSTETFRKIGLSMEESQLASIGPALMNAIMSFVSFALVKNFKRRKLLFISLGGCIFFLLLCTVFMYMQNTASWITYIPIFCFILFVCIFAFGLGPLPYMMGNELLPPGPRATGMGIGCACNWAATFMVAMLFPLIQQLLQEDSFLVFAGSLLIFGFYFYRCLPETKVSPRTILNCQVNDVV